MNRWQTREAKRIGLAKSLDMAAKAIHEQFQKRGREIRAENVRRTAAAS